MEVSQLKTGSKFQLTEDFGEDRGRSTKLWPEGLVFSLVSLTLNANGARVFLKVIRCKPVINKYYSKIDPEFYIGKDYRNTPSRNFVKLRLRGHEAQRFLDMIGTARLINFNREYESLTKYNQ